MFFMFFFPFKIDLQIPSFLDYNFHCIRTQISIFDANSQTLCVTKGSKCYQKPKRIKSKTRRKMKWKRNPFDKFIICWKVFNKTYLQLFKCRFKVKEHEQPLHHSSGSFCSSSQLNSFSLVNIGISLMWILNHLFMSAGNIKEKVPYFGISCSEFGKNTFQHVNLHTNRKHNHSIFFKLKTKLLKAFFSTS